MKALSPMDAMFLLAEHRRQPMHVAGLQLFKPPAGASRDFVTEIFEQMRGYPTPLAPYNRRVVFRGNWFWTEDEQFDLDHHLRHLALPHPGRIRELLAMCSRLHGALMDRSRPLWETNLIEGLADGRFAIYSKVHHSLFDGVSAMREARNMLSPDPAARGMPPLWARPRTVRRKAEDRLAHPASPLNALIQSLGLNVRILPGALRGFRDLFRRGGIEPGDVTPFQAPPTMFNVRIGSARRVAAQSYALDRIKAVGRRHGATVNDVALAMCSGALREYLVQRKALPDRPLTAMVPVSVRAADCAEGGNQVAIILADLGTHLADPVQRLERITASTHQAKARMASMTRLEQMAYSAAALSPMTFSSMLGLDRWRPPFNLVISNVPGPTERLYWNGAELVESYPMSIPIDGQALNITLTSYCDQIAFGYTACRRSVPGMQRLLEYTERALASLEVPSRTQRAGAGNAAAALL